MSRISALVLSVSLVALGSAAAAQGTTGAASASTPDTAAIDIVAKKLCQAEPIVGTRIPTPRKCNTPAQLKQFQAQAREMIESYRQRTPCLMGMESGDGKAMPC